MTRVIRWTIASFVGSIAAVGAAAGVPEPASALLCVLGLAAMAGGARARRAR